MSIDALVAGKLWKAPEQKRAGNGNPFVVAKVRAADGDGEGLFINVVAFSDSAQATLLALEEGDSVSLAGTLKIGTYEARDGSVRPSVSMVAQRVLTTYHVSRKRKTVADASSPSGGNGTSREPELADDDVDF
ncbi:single-stranded DNA-binding protein [Paraburkholderia sediminicola]|uniref:single-stranded DNA-binding protein n=1 Tax=Paraburkholderia sediminicola TaxID=458836 RepID=UPI0038B74A08